MKKNGNVSEIENITPPTTIKKVEQELKQKIHTTPVSYVIDDERSILIDLTNMNLFLLQKGEIIKNIKVLHKGPSTL